MNFSQNPKPLAAGRLLKVFLLVCLLLPAGSCGKDETDIPDMIISLQSADALLRKRTALEMARLGPKAEEAITALGKALYDQDNDVRDAAIYALSKIGTPEAKQELARVLPRLVSDLLDPSPERRWAAATALGYLGENGRDAVPALVRAVGDKEIAVSNAAAYALRKIGDPEALKLLAGDDTVLPSIMGRPAARLLAAPPGSRPPQKPNSQ